MKKKLLNVLKISKQSDKKHAIVVITEGITDVHALAKKVQAETGFETRANVFRPYAKRRTPKRS